MTNFVTFLMFAAAIVVAELTLRGYRKRRVGALEASADKCLRELREARTRSIPYQIKLEATPVPPLMNGAYHAHTKK